MEGMRELKLNCMKQFLCANDRTAKAAVDWLKWHRLPIRLLHHGNAVLELGGNDSAIVRFALRRIKAHGFNIVREIPWRPPAVLHRDFKFASRK